jgi:hypothetical protein
MSKLYRSKTPKSNRSKTPKSKTPKSKTRHLKSNKSKTPKSKTPKSKTPKSKTHHLKSNKSKTPKSKTRHLKSNKSKTPKSKTPKSKTRHLKSNRSKTPKSKTRHLKSNKSKTPKSNRSITRKSKTPKSNTRHLKSKKIKSFGTRSGDNSMEDHNSDAVNENSMEDHNSNNTNDKNNSPNTENSSEMMEIEGPEFYKQHMTKTFLLDMQVDTNDDLYFADPNYRNQTQSVPMEIDQEHAEKSENTEQIQNYEQVLSQYKKEISRLETQLIGLQSNSKAKLLEATIKELMSVKQELEKSKQSEENKRKTYKRNESVFYEKIASLMNELKRQKEINEEHIKTEQEKVRQYNIKLKQLRDREITSLNKEEKLKSELQNCENSYQKLLEEYSTQLKTVENSQNDLINKFRSEFESVFSVPSQEVVNHISKTSCKKSVVLPLQPNINWCKITKEKLVKAYKLLTNQNVNARVLEGGNKMNTNEIMLHLEGKSYQPFENRSRVTYYAINPPNPLNLNYMCDILHYALKEISLFNEYKIVTLLGVGVFGLCLLIQDSKMEQKAVKIMLPGSADGSWITPDKEIFVGKKIYDVLKIGPQIFSSQKINLRSGPSFMILQEKMDINASDYISCLATITNSNLQNILMRKFLLDLTRLFVTLQICNMTHMDLHTGNIMLKFDSIGGHCQAYLIDFGMFVCNRHYDLYDISKIIANLPLTNVTYQQKNIHAKMTFILSAIAKVLYPYHSHWNKNYLIDQHFYLRDVRGPLDNAHETGYMGCDTFNWDRLSSITIEGLPLVDYTYKRALQVYKQAIIDISNRYNNEFNEKL